jgi:hypothetical protein
MDKGPNFRIVGGIPENIKEAAKIVIESSVFNHLKGWPDQAKEDLIKFEIPKTPEQIEFINFANNETNRLMEEVGLQPYDFPIENFHFLPSEIFKKFSKSHDANATTIIGQHTVVVNIDRIINNSKLLKSVLFHEMLHVKGHVAWEIEEIKGDDIGYRESVYRDGVASISSQKKISENREHSHFDGLGEAIVVEQESRSVPGRGKFSYKEQREVLNYICEEISKSMSEKYANPDAVFKEFLSAHFTGRLLPIAKIIEKVFGKRSFRVLSNMNTDIESGILTLEYFQKCKIK